MKKATLLLILLTSFSFAAPPILDSIGTERKFNSFIFATEGQPVTFTAHAADPDGDEVHYFATNYPGWAHFDTNSGVFYGNAPFWPDDYSNRVAQPGVFDITLVADDGTYFVTNYISIYVMATNWLNESLDMRAIVTQRHLAAESVIGTPIDVSIVSDITRATSFGGAGKQIRIVQFAFTSQVPDTVEMESDWISLTNYAFLPVGAPAVPNAGGLIENNYGGLFGINELGERACAELDVPIVVIDAGWDLGHGSDNMTACNTKSNETGDPRYLMYAYSVGHYMRGADALATVIDQLTTQMIEHSTFKIIPMGHSKFGQTCTASAAAFPERVVGFLPTGAASFDSAVARLLNKLQGADPSAPEMSPTYLGCLMRNYIEMLDLANKQASTNAVVIAAFGTDENKNDLDDYKPKYTLFAADKEVELNKRMGCVPNAPHIMTKIGEKYVAAIPANSVALFVELGDFADGLTGIVTSSINRYCYKFDLSCKQKLSFVEDCAG